ncbi:MAG: hypothetical protein C3F06_02355 [Candidatus Methanoperedenaceae archaeon]|nr:MAG: hypothetical protein C3F06_02355 [Candidatus Methanoperedenaceae archaeon]
MVFIKDIACIPHISKSIRKTTNIFHAHVNFLLDKTLALEISKRYDAVFHLRKIISMERYHKQDNRGGFWSFLSFWRKRDKELSSSSPKMKPWNHLGGLKP